MIGKSFALYCCLCSSEGKTSRLFLVTSLMMSLFYPFFPWTLYLTDNTRYVNCCIFLRFFYWGNGIFEPLNLKTFLKEQTPLAAVCSTFGGLLFRRNPSSGPPTDSKNYQKCVSKFYSTWLANRQWLYNRANHGAYSNPGTQFGALFCRRT